MKYFKLLREGLPAYRASLDKAMLDELSDGFHSWLVKATRGSDPGRELVYFLLHEIDRILLERSRLSSAYSQFSVRLSEVLTRREKTELILRFSAQLGASRRQLRGDRRSIRRYFDDDAITERYFNLMAKRDQELSLVLERLGYVYGVVLAETGEGWERRQG